jgi:hypothetical protein
MLGNVAFWGLGTLLTPRVPPLEPLHLHQWPSTYATNAMWSPSFSNSKTYFRPYSHPLTSPQFLLTLIKLLFHALNTHQQISPGQSKQQPNHSQIHQNPRTLNPFAIRTSANHPSCSPSPRHTIRLIDHHPSPTVSVCVESLHNYPKWSAQHIRGARLGGGRANSCWVRASR